MHGWCVAHSAEAASVSASRLVYHRIYRVAYRHHSDGVRRVNLPLNGGVGDRCHSCVVRWRLVLRNVIADVGAAVIDAAAVDWVRRRLRGGNQQEETIMPRASLLPSVVVPPVRLSD